MPFTYPPGEVIKQGDQVLFHGVPGQIKFVVDPLSSPDDWFVTECGGGAMLLDSEFGDVFFDDPHNHEDLVLVSRLHAGETDQK